MNFDQSSDLVATFKKVTNKRDINTVVVLTNSIWNEYYVPILGKNQVDYMLDNVFSENALVEQIEQGFIYFLIEYGRKGVGCLGIQIREEDILVSNLYLCPKHQGLGIGRKTLAMVQNLSRSKGLKWVTMRVHKENIKAIVSCYRLGFKKTGEICRSIGGAYVIDDLIMQIPAS